MDQIIKNIEDPSWWFTGLFFLLIGILLTKLVFEWVPDFWSRIYSLMPRVAQGIARHNEKRILTTIKRTRQHEVKIYNLIVRYWSLATIWIMLFIFGIVYYSTYPFGDLIHLSKNRLTFLLPMYGIMLLVVWEKRVLTRAISAHVRWKNNITKLSRKQLYSTGNPYDHGVSSHIPTKN